MIFKSSFRMIGLRGLAILGRFSYFCSRTLLDSSSCLSSVFPAQVKEVAMIRRALCLGAVLTLIAASGSLHAQKYQIFNKTLKNGLEVIVIQNHAVPLVTVEIDVRNGGYTESPEYSGLSHLYEHMFFKVNKAIPNQERYLERLRELGAVWNGTTSDERVNYFFTVPRDSIVPALNFMYDAISGPLFLQDELVKERPVVTGEYDRAESSPFFALDRAVNQKVWWKHFSYKNVLGDRQVILSATTEKMQTKAPTILLFRKPKPSL